MAIALPVREALAPTLAHGTNISNSRAPSTYCGPQNAVSPGLTTTQEMYPMTKPSVSVAMCTYNGSRFLRDQLRSIARQSQQPDELVVSDDGSTDATLGILESFASQVGFSVRILVNTRRLGPAKNFEKAIEACGGDIIGLSDQDDVWRPDKLGSLVAVFNQHPQAVYAFSDALMVDQFGNPTGQTLWEAVSLRKRLAEFSGLGQVEILLKRNIIPGAAMAFRSAFRHVVLPIPASWMHDYWIALLGSVFAYGVPVSEPLFQYRRHADQVCGWRKKTFAQVCKDSVAMSPAEGWGKLDTFRELERRVVALASKPAIADRLELLKEKESHLVKRAEARSSTGVPRLAGVLAEVWTGRYQRFSNSWYSIIRDL
jgi:glycosyltransferase involved in cell wall biosynthesis